jgi:hypothetical protein
MYYYLLLLFIGKNVKRYACLRFCFLTVHHNNLKKNKTGNHKERWHHSVNFMSSIIASHSNKFKCVNQEKKNGQSQLIGDIILCRLYDMFRPYVAIVTYSCL